MEALQYILNVTNYPLLIMDLLGKHITGTVVGCLRKVQKWKLTSIFQEYRRFSGLKGGQPNEQFIELFDTDLVHIPPHPPSWL